MKTTRFFFILCVLCTYSFVGWAQTTTYTSSLSIGTNGTCPSTDINNSCGKFLGRNNIRMKITSIEGNRVYFEFSKCDGSKFSENSKLLLYIAPNSTPDKEVPCETTHYMVSQTIGGLSKISTYHDLTYTTGSKKFCGIVEGKTDNYYTNIITITATTPSVADLRLNSSMSFGSTTLTKGKEYTFTTIVKNFGTSSWTGGLYLKIGSSNVDSWYETISAGSTKTLSCYYTPDYTGTYTFTLYYATGDVGSGTKVPDGNYTNPITVTVSEGGGGGGGNCNFSDPTSGNAYYDATCYLSKRSVIDGNGSGNMRTEKDILRAELAKAAFRGVYSLKGRTPDGIYDAFR